MKTPEEKRKVTRFQNREIREEEKRIDKENEVMCEMITIQVSRVMGYKSPFFSNKKQQVSFRNPNNNNMVVVDPRKILKALHIIGDGEFKNDCAELCYYLKLKGQK